MALHLVQLRPRLNKILAAGLLLLQGSAWAAPAPADTKTSDGMVMPISQSTHFSFGKLGIGVLATEVGPYLDEKEVRHDGLHAALAISVEKAPDAYRQVYLAPGDSVEIAGYRIKVEHINTGSRRVEDGEGGGVRGSAVLRLWAPPAEPAKPRRKWWPFW